MPRVFKLAEFDKDCSKLDKSEQIRVEKILEQLYVMGSVVGKPLAGLSYFREKKFDGKRLYFLYYRNLNVILVVGISDKKAQQTTINKILQEISYYHQHVLELVKK